MSLMVYLRHTKEYLNEIRLFFPQKLALSTTQKVVILSFSTSIIVVGVLARYFRRKKRVVDPIKFRRNPFSSKRSRTSGVRSPNGDLGSTTSSGRRSAAFSNIYGEKYLRQSSLIASGKASIASGSLASTGLPIPEGADTADLTPQQLGVMGPEDFKNSTGIIKESGESSSG